MFSLPPFRRIMYPLFMGIYAVLSVYVMIVFTIGSDLAVDSVPVGNVVFRPVAYRMMVPAFTEALQAAIPDALKPAITSGLISARDSALGTHLLMLRYNEFPKVVPPAIADNYIFITFTKLVIVYLTMIAFIWMFYKLTQALLPESPFYALLAPVIFLLLIPVFAWRVAFTYDFAELFFSCALFYLLYYQRWRHYLLCLAVATLNKETTVFAIFFYFMWFCSRLPRKEFIRLGVLQVVIYALVKGAIVLYFADRPGVLIEHNLEHNFLYSFNYNYYTFTSLLFAALLVTYHWHEKPEFLRGGLWMTLANYVAMVITCRPAEYRDLYWGMPVLIILATHSLLKLTFLSQGDGRHGSKVIH